MATAWRRRRDGAGLESIELAAVEPGPGRVTVAVEAVDLGALDATRPGAVPGVAAVGVVIATGPEADEWRGARVLVPALEACGQCDRCRRGGVAVCAHGAHRGVTGPGALATTITASSRWLVRLEGGLALPGDATAAIAGELAWAYALYARASVGPRDPVIAIGAGARLRALAAIIAAKGAPLVIASDDAPTTAGLPDATICAIHTAAIEEALAGLGVDARPRKILVTDGRFLEAAVRVANPCAIVVVAAAPTAAMTVPLEIAMASEVTVAGVAGCHPDLLPELAALVARGDVALAPLVTSVPVAQLADALAERAQTRPATSLVVRLAD